jgi:hypothetical protein
MKTCIRLALALAVLCPALSGITLAADNAYLYLVQGIPGRDYSASTDPQFPVDVLINDDVCYQRGLTYGTITGPLTLVPGTYNVKVSVADSLLPCSNPAFVDRTISLEAGENVSAVVALSETGSPTLLTFTNQLSPVTATMGRVLFAQAADAPALEVILQNRTTMKVYTYAVNHGVLLDVNLPAGSYNVEINQGTTTLVASTSVDLYSQSVLLLYGVGQASNQTVNLEYKNVRNVIQ